MFLFFLYISLSFCTFVLFYFCAAVVSHVISYQVHKTQYPEDPHVHLIFLRYSSTYTAAAHRVVLLDAFGLKSTHHYDTTLLIMCFFDIILWYGRKAISRKFGRIGCVGCRVSDVRWSIMCIALQQCLRGVFGLSSTLPRHTKYSIKK